ncbi:MAG: 50S ribosomal protein L11 methyltransferase [Kiritimatiellae bacterium]|nr:50S ribosomal protein L11 methyltransferase [Kiritimatiellia bacterium]
MTKVSCSVSEQFVNPLFEVFDGGDFILSSYRDIEKSLTDIIVYFDEKTLPEGVPGKAEACRIVERKLEEALKIVGAEADISVADVPDDDWMSAYRRHFKTELVSPRILVQPEWEELAVIKFDPGMAFGTGKHETTKACLQYIDECAPEGGSFLDMGCGSGILSIAAAKLGYGPVAGFDVDQEAVDASVENAAKNRVEVEFFKYGLGGRVRKALPEADLVAANILGPLLIRFADEIVESVKRRIIISGILAELYPEVLAAYEARGFKELSRKTIGEWTTGLLTR